MKNLKASIIMSIYNKPEVLPNTLMSIARQKTSFPLEVCIVDDLSDIDPEPIIKKFLPDAKYRRLRKNHGFAFSKNVCLDMVSDDTTIIVPMAADIIMLRDDAVENLCSRVSDKNIVISEICNMRVKKDMYLNFDAFSKPILSDWNGALAKSLKPNITCRKNMTSWLFFLGAILKKNIIDLGYRRVSCDAVLWQKMAKGGYSGELLTTVKAVHQYHKSILIPCKIDNTCAFYCSRTVKNGRWKGRGGRPKIKPLSLI